MKTITKSQQVIPLIYKTAIEQGAFIDLMDALTDGAVSDIDEAELLLHYEQAGDIVGKISQLEHQKAIAETIFNRLKTGIVLLDQQANICFCNAPAQRLLQQHHSIEVLDRQTGLEQLVGSKLQFTDTRMQEQLRQKLELWSLGQQASSVDFILETADQAPQVVVCSQISEVSELLAMHVPQNVVAALFFSYQGQASLSNQKASQKRLQQLYRLTPVEADITARLAGGQTIEDIAEARNSKPRTIRGYLKSIFCKTGVSRQADLMALVLNAPLQVADVEKNVLEYGSDQQIALHGRTIGFRDYGPKHGRPLLWCHASLSCRYGVPLDLSLLQHFNLRLIAIERGGVGLSEGLPYQQVIDIANDVITVLDYLGLDKVDIGGVVAGGAYALATAWKYPERINEVLLLESFAPNVAEHTLKGAPGYFRMMPRLIKHFPKVSERMLSFQLRDFANDWQKALQHTSKLFNPFDAQILLREDVKYHALMEGIENNRQGVSALVQDIFLVHGDWGVPIEQIQPRCHVVYGQADPVASRYANELLELLPNAQGHFRENEGFARMLYLNFFEIICQIGWDKK